MVMNERGARANTQCFLDVQRLVPFILRWERANEPTFSQPRCVFFYHGGMSSSCDFRLSGPQLDHTDSRHEPPPGRLGAVTLAVLRSRRGEPDRTSIKELAGCSNLTFLPFRVGANVLQSFAP